MALVEGCDENIASAVSVTELISLRSLRDDEAMGELVLALDSSSSLELVAALP